MIGVSWLNQRIQMMLCTVLICSALSFTEEICEMKITRCPETYNNATVVVPKKVISLSGKYYVCKPKNIEIEEKTDPPSIMFVIDHSTSMSGTSGTDPSGSRFNVSKALIDTIFKRVPKAEIGLAVFRNALFFDTINEPNAVALPADYPHPYGISSQAYIPLLQLDSTYKNGEKGADILKRLLTTHDTIVRRVTVTDLNYKPTFETESGTNINTGFDAAKFAMLKARNPKKNQFIIFLSDGEPNPDTVDSMYHGGKDPDEFQQGTNVPTTFTVYFVTGGGTVPKSIATMTENIAANNYSETNKISKYWGLKTSYDTLLSILNNQTNSIIHTITSSPTKLIINNVTYSQYNSVDSTFPIDHIPLVNTTTPISLSLSYQIKNDTSSQAIDSVQNISFTILRSDSLPSSEGVELTCRDTIYYDVSVTATKKNASEKNLEEGTFEFKRNNSDHGDLTVYFSIQGTATMGSDYQSFTDSVVFTGNQTVIKKSITPIADIIKEGQESVVITILPAKENRVIKYTVGTPNTDQVIIDDNYTEPQVSIVVIKKNALEQNLEESVVEFRRSHSEYGDLTVYFSVTGTAAMGSDYQSFTDSLVFTEKQTAIQKKITPLSDSVKEDTETVIFQILAQKEDRNVRYVIANPDRAETIIEDYFPDMPDTFSLVITPNPLDLHNDASYSQNVRKIFKNIFSNQSSRGALIAIKSTRGLLPVGEGSDVYGKAVIYDGVGNLVKVLDLKKGNDADTTHYGSLWDGKNLKGRNVGNGMYLADIKVISTTRQEKRFTKKVGIK
jgi:hypothetical protein